jgi:hypothetical protein
MKGARIINSRRRLSAENTDGAFCTKFKTNGLHSAELGETMTIQAVVEMYEKFTVKEKNRVKQAFREFLTDFNCNGCPCYTDYMSGTNDRYDFLNFIIRKQMEARLISWQCRLCHAFPILLPKLDRGCPCKMVSRTTAKRRLQRLVASWE